MFLILLLFKAMLLTTAHLFNTSLTRMDPSPSKFPSTSKIKKGYPLFFTTSKRKNRIGLKKIGHVALYLGNGKILHTFRQGKEVMITDLKPNWAMVLIGARRIIDY
jgi:cell wall-associated NlpC family hydrolase